VTATLVTGRRGDALAVPNDALLEAGLGSDRAAVLRVRGGRVERVPVRQGLRGLAMSEVLEGLSAGDTVVAAGALDPGALPEAGDRARIRVQPAPEAGQAGGEASRGELPVQLDSAMGIEASIALRCLRQGRAQTLLIRIGISVGVSVIVFVTALISGLQGNVIERTLGTQAHIRVEAPREINRIAHADDGVLQLVLEDPRPQSLRPIDNWLEVQGVLDRLPGINAVSPLVSGPAFGRRGEALESVALVGIDPPRYLRVIPLGEHIVEGRLGVGSGNAVVGRKLADDLGLRLGGKLRLEAGDGRDAIVTVAGIFELGVRELDSRYVYVDLKQAQS